MASSVNVPKTYGALLLGGLFAAVYVFSHLLIPIKEGLISDLADPQADGCGIGASDSVLQALYRGFTSDKVPGK